MFGQLGAQLIVGDVARVRCCLRNEVGARFDTVRMPVAALRLGAEVAGVALTGAPADGARRGLPQTLRRLATRQATTRVHVDPRKGFRMHAGLPCQHAV